MDLNTVLTVHICKLKLKMIFLIDNNYSQSLIDNTTDK